MALGAFLPSSKLLTRLPDWLQNIALYGLMFMMGLRMQADPQIWVQLGIIGLQALVIALAAVAGSVLLVYAFQTFYFRKRRMDIYGEEPGIGAKESNPIKTLLSILGCMALGVAAGYFGGELAFFRLLTAHNSLILDILLCVLIAASGMMVGQQKGIWQDIKKSGWALVAVPLCTMLASVLSAVLVAPLLGLAFWEAASCGAGCGWYSLTGAVLSEVRPELGALGLLSNLLREMIALGVTPFVAKKFGPLPAVAPGAGTTTDVTLPVIIRSTSPANGILAFANGLVMTLLIPFALRLLVSLA